MRSSFALGLLLFTLSCDGAGDDGIDNDAGKDAGGDASTNDSGTDDGGTADSGSTDMGVDMVQCDPDFGQPDACGGDLSGTWSYRAACGTTPIATMIQQQCSTVDIRADAIEGGSGTLTVNGTSLTLDVELDVHVEAGLPAACTFNGCAGTQLVLQQALPQATIACTAAAAGCDCTIDGPVGQYSTGTFTTSGGIATVDGTDTYYFCVEGGSLSYRRFGTGIDEPVYVLDR
jgi:hypothetical protein